MIGPTQGASLRELLAHPDRLLKSLVLVASYRMASVTVEHTSEKVTDPVPDNTLKLYRSFEGTDALTASTPSTWFVWWRKPDCWRDDFSFDTGGKTSIVSCNGVITQYLATDAIYTTEAPVGFSGRVRLESSDGDMIDRRTASERAKGMPLLSGMFALDGWELLRGSERQHCGRQGIEFQAKWQGPGDAPTSWPWMRDYRGIVDAERGILLECTGLLTQGQDGVVVSATAVSFDEAIPDDIFIVDAPKGTKVIRVRA